MEDQEIIEQMKRISESHPGEGFWKMYYRMRNSGIIVNHKRLHRIYKKIGLSLRRKSKRRLPARKKERLQTPPCYNHTWSIDFMCDVLYSGRKIKAFNVIDDYNREILHIEIDYSIRSNKVAYILNHLIKRHSKPKRIRMDNGPEFIANLMQSWSELNEIELVYIQPAKPYQNGFIERFNRTYRGAVLDAYILESIDQLREVTECFMQDYNYERPHDALGGLPPVKFREQGGNRTDEKEEGYGFRSAALHYTHNLLPSNT